MADSDIPALYKPLHDKLQKMNKITSIIILVCLLFTAAGCGTSNKQKTTRHKVSAQETVLSPEESRKFDYFFLEAMRMKQKGDLDAAYELLQHCIEINPESGATLYELAKFYLYLGQEEKGEQALKKAVRSNESNFWYKQILAQYYENKRDFPKAISVYEDMAEQFPDRLEPLLSLTDLYNSTKSYQNVVTTLNRIEELDGKSEQISMEKFRMYLLQGKNDDAFAEIESLAKEYPYDMRYQTILGDVYLNNNKPDEAYNTYRRILKEVPGYAPAIMSLANYYQKTGQDSLYQTQLDTILLNDDVQSDTKMEIMRQAIIQTEQTTKDSTQIVSLFKRILKRPQQNADLSMLCAQYCVSKNMKADATLALKQVIKLDPENTPARLQLIGYALQDEDPDKVIEVARPAIEYNPDVLEFYYYLGLAYYNKGQTDEAAATFEKGVKQVNEKTDKKIVSDFYSMMGDIYHQKGKNAEAYAAYDSSLVYNPDNIGTMNNYAYFLSVERKSLDKAEEMSYRTVKAEPSNATFLDTYAWILFEKGKYTEARIYMEQALQNDQNPSRVLLEHAGDIYYMAGQKEKALEYWKKADAKPVEKNEEAPSEKDKQRLKQKIAQKKYIAN